MGTVYLAEDTKLDRRVAVKVLNLPDSPEEMRLRMTREARVLARLEHPGIVPVHDAGISADGRVFYVMKFVRGSRLDHHAREVDSLLERLRAFQKICEAVAFAHAHGVIHRDLKPQNVMVGRFGEVLVMDWGVAKVLGEVEEDKDIDLRETAPFPNKSLPHGRATESPRSRSTEAADETAEGTILGTPAYMSPEQALGLIDQVDERADVYALGAILYFLLTNRAPFDSTSASDIRRRVANEDPAPPRLSNSTVPKPLEAVCLKAMSRERESRYESAQALSDEVTRFLDGLPVLAYRESAMERALRFLARNRFIVLLILAYLIMRIFVLLVSGR
ncbi:MAG: serine/threonine protein kinase [Blastocatellia bacterium]|nr:serine/threonine protein kinase [Blastocatellia bacterium]